MKAAASRKRPLSPTGVPSLPAGVNGSSSRKQGGGTGVQQGGVAGPTSWSYLFPGGGKSTQGGCRAVTTFEKKSRIGEGAYGTVYSAVDKDSKEVVALKRVILHNEKQDGFPLTSLREVQLLKRINHPNCVKLLDVVVGAKRDNVFLVFEYCEHDLGVLLDSVRDPFSEGEVKGLLEQLLKAVEYLHEHWIIHRDLKMSNLLYTNRGQLKVADFGLARTYGFPTRPLTPKVVTLWYRCPELLLGCESYATAVDMWSVGCIFGELLRARPLLPGKNETDQLDLIFKLLGCPTARIWPDLPNLPRVRSNTIRLDNVLHKYNTVSNTLPSLSRLGLDMLNGLLCYDPAKRVTAREARRHAYLREMPYPKPEEIMPTFPSQHQQSSSSASANAGGSGSSRMEQRGGERGGGVGQRWK